VQTVIGWSHEYGKMVTAQVLGFRVEGSGFKESMGQGHCAEEKASDRRSNPSTVVHSSIALS